MCSAEEHYVCSTKMKGKGQVLNKAWQWIDNCLTPSQPRRSYQGDMAMEETKEKQQQQQQQQ